MTETIFYDVPITNTGSELDKEARVEIRLAGKVLDNQTKYKMIVQKFTIDGEALPLTIMEIKNPQTPKTQDWETIHNVYIVDGSGNVASAMYYSIQREYQISHLFQLELMEEWHTTKMQIDISLCIDIHISLGKLMKH